MKSRISYPETLTIHSIEDFISVDDANKLLMMCNKQFSNYNGDLDTVFPSEDFKENEVFKFYVPNGRREFGKISSDICTFLDKAVKRNLTSIQNIFPGVKRALPWNYVEYGVNQYCTSHVDYIDKTDLNEIIYAGIGVMLHCPDQGGELYIETCGSPKLIVDKEVISDCNHSNKNFIKMPKTKWVVQQSIGTAVIYGTQTIHGTNPVKKGKCCKILSWLVG